MKIVTDIFVAPPTLLEPWRDELEHAINHATRSPAELEAERAAFNRAVNRYRNRVRVAPLRRIIIGKEQV